MFRKDSEFEASRRMAERMKVKEEFMLSQAEEILGKKLSKEELWELLDKQKNAMIERDKKRDREMLEDFGFDLSDVEEIEREERREERREECCKFCQFSCCDTDPNYDDNETIMCSNKNLIRDIYALTMYSQVRITELFCCKYFKKIKR